MGHRTADGGVGVRYPIEPAYAHEAEEARDAAHFSTATCYRHDWASDHRGGGICLNCAETVSAADL